MAAACGAYRSPCGQGEQLVSQTDSKDGHGLLPGLRLPHEELQRVDGRRAHGGVAGAVADEDSVEVHLAGVSLEVVVEGHDGKRHLLLLNEVPVGSVRFFRRRSGSIRQHHDIAVTSPGHPTALKNASFHFQSQYFIGGIMRRGAYTYKKNAYFVVGPGRFVSAVSKRSCGRRAHPP